MDLLVTMMTQLMKIKNILNVINCTIMYNKKFIFSENIKRKYLKITCQCSMNYNLKVFVGFIFPMNTAIKRLTFDSLMMQRELIVTTWQPQPPIMLITTVRPGLRVIWGVFTVITLLRSLSAHCAVKHNMWVCTN